MVDRIKCKSCQADLKTEEIQDGSQRVLFIYPCKECRNQIRELIPQITKIEDYIDDAMSSIDNAKDALYKMREKD
jgi:hypothetical protein